MAQNLQEIHLLQEGQMGVKLDNPGWHCAPTFRQLYNVQAVKWQVYSRNSGIVKLLSM